MFLVGQIQIKISKIDTMKFVALQTIHISLYVDKPHSLLVFACVKLTNIYLIIILARRCQVFN